MACLLSELRLPPVGQLVKKQVMAELTAVTRSRRRRIEACEQLLDNILVITGLVSLVPDDCLHSPITSLLSILTLLSIVIPYFAVYCTL